MSRVIGIDLGATNSVAAVIEGGSPVIIPSAEGTRLCPSVTAFTQDGEILVGLSAKRQAFINPENTIYAIKHFLGRRFDETEQERNLVSYAVEEGSQGDIRLTIPVSGRSFTPEEIAALILMKLKNDAEAYLGEPVTGAVISVPASFNERQRQATENAGKLAGFELLRIVNESTASALAYGLDKKADENVLVFSPGGSTSSVSMLKVGECAFELEYTSRPTFAGGADWDKAIIDWISNLFEKEHGIDLRKDRRAVQRLSEAAEQVKIELSSGFETEINLPYIYANAQGPKHLQMHLNRATFEKIAAPLLEKLQKSFEAALKEAKYKPSHLQSVVLVGGASHIPAVVDLVRSLTGMEPLRGIRPEEAAAIGAAFQAGVLTGQAQTDQRLAFAPLSLGLETKGGLMTRIIERNTPVPVTRKYVFSTEDENQTSVDIHVLQGEHPTASENISLGYFRLEGITPAASGVPEIEVTYEMDTNGVLKVAAKDLTTRRIQKVAITVASHLGLAEIERLAEEAENNNAADEQLEAHIDIRSAADMAIHEARKALGKANGSTGAVLAYIETVQKSVSEGQPEQILVDIQKLQQAVASLSSSSGNPNHKVDDPSRGSAKK